jgi:eukaryotic-like serine/threonine-protein kinase
MSQSARSTVLRVLQAARALAPTERGEYLDLACAGDAELRAEVERQLLALEAAQTIVPAATAENAGRPPASRRQIPTLSSGDLIGQYRVVSVLGEGGFGMVYLADQEQPVRRRVAVKILKPGMDSAGVLARFEQEQQALAVMDHPNVARVFDAGVTPPEQGSRPYFVMEHVPGETITAYCDRGRLDLRSRLELFIPVCEAVQHAHMKGIIHRDLKPSNVLVQVVDGKPVPKVIDFGVAKALSRSLTEHTLHTEQGLMIGTPEYMAPEQAEAPGSRGGAALDIDTRADVYSLGVMLYELLTGVLPFDPAVVRRAGYAGIRKYLRDTEPPRPSARLSSLSRVGDAPNAGGAARAESESETTLGEIAARRRVDPGVLTRQLRRELEWIPLRAMRKEREERYRSPADLAEDLRNYLAGRPLVAGPESVAYRARKFVKRNRAGVGAAAAAVLLLAGSTIVLASLLARAQRAEARTLAALSEAQREVERRREAEGKTALALVEAKAEAAKSNAVNEFVRRMLNAADPGKDGRQVKVADVLDRATKEIDRSLSDQPGVAAAMHETLGMTYQGLGLHDEAIAHFKDMLEIRRTTLGEEHPETLISMVSLAVLERAKGAEGAKSSEEMLRRALDGLVRTKGENSKEATRATFVLGQLLGEQGKPAEAEPLMRRAAEIARTMPASDEEAALWLGTYGIQLVDKGDLAGAEVYCREGLERALKVYGEEHPSTFWLLNVMGRWHQARGEFDLAEPLYKRAFDAAVRVQGAEHPSTIYWMHNYARILQEQKRNEESRAVYEAMLPIQLKVNGENADTLFMMSNMAVLYQAMKEYPKAERMLRDVVEKGSSTLGREHPNLLVWMNNLARLLDETKRPADAEVIYKDLVERARKAIPGDFRTALFERNYAGCLVTLGRLEEAEPLMLSAEKVIAASVPATHMHARTSWQRLADLYEKLGRVEEAKPWREKYDAAEKAAKQ